MGLVRFDPSVLKRRPQVLDFCNSERAFPLAEWLYGRRAWSVSRSVQADHLSEWAGGQLKLGWLREPHFFMLILFFVLHLFITVVFLAREHGKSKCVGRNQPPPPPEKKRLLHCPGVIIVIVDMVFSVRHRRSQLKTTPSPAHRVVQPAFSSRCWPLFPFVSLCILSYPGMSALAITARHAWDWEQGLA